MATFTAVSGRDGRLFSGSFEIGFKKAMVKEVATEGDTTNSTGGGGIDQEIGPIGLEIAVEADADSANNPWDLGLLAGNNVANVKLFLKGTGGPYFGITLATLCTADTTQGIKDPVIIGRNFTLKSKGLNFVLPTGPFSVKQ
jgi:hypothetical protein